MFVNSWYCSVGLCILINLSELCQGQRPRQNDGLAFRYPEDNVERKNALNRAPVNVASSCRHGEILYPSATTDDWICECKPGYIYHAATMQCYPAFTRGPCSQGQYLILPRNKVTPECQQNPCVRDNFVSFRGGCFELYKAGPCSASQTANVVGVNETTLEIICTKDSTFGRGDQFNQETPACAIGGKRWTQNMCTTENNGIGTAASDAAATRGTRINIQAAKLTNKNEEIAEYSASDNACQRYSKGVSTNEQKLWNYRNEYPWMAALGYLDGEYRIFYSCNGILISETFILTTAACVTRRRNSVNLISARRNLLPVFARMGIGLQRDYYVKDIIPHPYYNATSKKNDIALIRIVEPITLSESNVLPACLETNLRDEDSHSGAMLVESGWGRHTVRSQNMLKSNLQAMPLLQCNRTIMDLNKDKAFAALRHGISKSQFCAYDPNNTGQSCRILSGGALQTFQASDSLLPKIVGVTSFGFGGGCSNKQPAIFTRVANYVPWIESNVWPFDRRKTVAVNRDGTNAANTLNDANDSSLISAARNGNEQTVTTLLLNGANVNQIIDGETALHAVAISGHEKIARLLIHNGADWTIQNKDGKSASDLATASGNSRLARVLQQNVAQKACDIYSNLPVVTTRIWGGDDVESDHEFPWMAALGYLDSNLKVGFNCGGTLISDRFVLTAMHCVQPSNPPVVVRLGQIDLINDKDEKIAENHHVKDIIRHPDYSFFDKTNDIALIELEERVYFSQTVRPACLQTYLADENPDVDLTVAGWGIVDPIWHNRSSILRKTTLKTMPLAECSTTIMNQAQLKRWTSFQNGTRQSHYCAVDPNHMTDTCQGDSGGPLQIIRKYFDLSTVVGVVSTGPSCGGTLPGIYTRVAYFVDWIESYVWPNGEIPTPKINLAEIYE